MTTEQLPNGFIPTGKHVILPAGQYAIAIEDKGTLTLAIKYDGTLIRGPGFTTVDEMSIDFWETVAGYICSKEGGKPL